MNRYDAIRPNLPERAHNADLMLHRQFSPDDVLYMGALTMLDGRTMLVFEQDGKRRAIAFKGGISELNNEQAEREIEWTRKKLLPAEACLTTIYRPSASGSAPSKQEAKAEATPDDSTFLPDVQTLKEKPELEPEVLPGLSGAGDTSQSFDLPADRQPRNRSTKLILDASTIELDPTPEYKWHEKVEGRD